MIHDAWSFIYLIGVSIDTKNQSVEDPPPPLTLDRDPNVCIYMLDLYCHRL